MITPRVVRRDAEPSQEVPPETRLLQVRYSSWLELAREKIKKQIALPDDVLMTASRDKIVCVMIREKYADTGYPRMAVAFREMNELDKSMPDTGNDRVLALFKKRVDMRDRLIHATGGRRSYRRMRETTDENGIISRTWVDELEPFSSWGERVTDRTNIIATALTMHNLGIMPPPPQTPVKRQKLSEAVMDQKQRDADRVAIEMMGE